MSCLSVTVGAFVSVVEVAEEGALLVSVVLHGRHAEEEVEEEEEEEEDSENKAVTRFAMSATSKNIGTASCIGTKVPAQRHSISTTTAKNKQETF